MAQLQLALNVPDLETAIIFYSQMFSTEPSVVRAGYANFRIIDPPLKLVLFEDKDVLGGTINHLGVEVNSKLEVTQAEERLVSEGIKTTGIEDVACCYAEKTETWINGPDGTRWEWYVRTGDSEQLDKSIKNCC